MTQILHNYPENTLGRKGIGVPFHRYVGAAAALSFGALVYAASGSFWEVGFDLSQAALVLPVFAVGYARVAGLDHPTRVRIYNHLLVLPGDHFRSIVRSLRIGVGEGRHHLNVMLRSGLIREDKSNGRCRYYAEGQGPMLDRNELFAKHWGYRDLRLRVLYAVRNLGDAKPSAVAQALGISRQLAAYHLTNLEELGLITRVGRHYRAP